MPRKGRTRQYQSHTLKLRHWLLEVKIHHFPRRGAACRPHPSCCSPGTRLCPLWGQRELGVRAVPLHSSPCQPAQPSPGRTGQPKHSQKNSVSPSSYLKLLVPCTPRGSFRLWNSSRISLHSQGSWTVTQPNTYFLYAYWTD